MNKKRQKPMCKMLTVDDELGIDTFFQDFFASKNFEVFNALNGKDAIRIVKEERPSIVLLDVNMRGMDGVEVLKKIKEIDNNIKVIMISGVDNEETIKRAKDLGADDYLVKPFSLEYLEKVVLLKFINLKIRDLG